MGKLHVDEVWIYIICCLLFLLFGLMIFLWILLYRLKSKLYIPLQESIESVSTTINSNRLNIPLQDRKESDQLLRIRADFEKIQSQPQFTSYVDSAKEELPDGSVAPDAKEPKDQVDNTNENKIKQTTIQQSLLLRQQMDKIVKELLDTKNKRLPAFNTENNVGNSYELREITKVKSKSIRASTRVKSKSTTDLDIYDVLPSPQRIRNTSVAAEGEEYSTPKSGHAVIVDDESGYLLPLTLKLSYANASSK